MSVFGARTHNPDGLEIMASTLVTVGAPNWGLVGLLDLRSGGGSLRPALGAFQARLHDGRRERSLRPASRTDEASVIFAAGRRIPERRRESSPRAAIE
jgi:hypothetical protein